ncbi:macrophage mannose receptor 1-like [Gigantopelta aegis]|uniref:macrophage mannose receptor 1-like n=1 Tax=Gigantopelta aegis TaxID=1735272 RepID=UPI001B887A8E|nr:macrophage mannose receptor 1-like [Gigantopelta aegis]
MIKPILIIIFASYSHLSSADKGGCSPPWIASDTYCYYFGNNQSVSWAEAMDECNLRLGQLLRIESPTEAAFIKSYFKRYPAPAYWTILNDIDPSGLIDKGTGTWLWGTDEYPIDTVLKWNVEPDNSRDENCCALNVKATFSDEPCSRKLGYICKLTLPSSKTFIETVLSVLHYGSCPLYWLQGKQAVDCFYVSNVTDPAQLVTWTDAKGICAKMHSDPGASAPFLLTINSQQDATFWTKRLFQSWSVKSPMKYWTGLNDRQTEGTYVWDHSPGSTTQFVNWTKEPDNLAGMENCGVILDEGVFSDRNCRQQNGFICRKPQVNQQYPVNFGCGDWFRAGQKCYLTFDKPKSNWLSARDFCRSLGGDLLKVENKDEERWLNVQSKTGTVAWGGHWIGLNDIAAKDHVNGWVWADGTKADTSLLNWDSSPNNVGGTSSCAAILQDGVYSDADCHLAKKGFICKKDYTGTCPANWKVNGPSCYYFSQKWTTWVEALDKCKQLSGDNSGYLLAITNANEKVNLQFEFYVQKTCQKDGGYIAII